jgi:hypothetical protein
VIEQNVKQRYIHYIHIWTKLQHKQTNKQTLTDIHNSKRAWFIYICWSSFGSFYIDFIFFVFVIIFQYVPQSVTNNKLLLAKIYGSHFPMKLQIEEVKQKIYFFHRPTNWWTRTKVKIYKLLNMC